MKPYITNIQNAQAEDKIRSLREMPAIIDRLRATGFTVVLAQGVFDIVHLGHVGYLRASRKIAADKVFLIVGVDNDETVRANKGTTRPINPLADRLHVLSEFASIGLVFGYQDVPRYDRPEDYIARYKALKASRISVPVWDPNFKLKEIQAREAGASLALVDYQHQNSTTIMLKKVGYE